MSDYDVRREAAAHAACDIQDCFIDPLDTSGDVGSQIRDALDNGYFSAPDVVYTYQCWDVVNDSRAPEPDEEPDFSACESAIACVTLEANAIMDVAYREALDDIITDVENALNDLACETGIDEWDEGGAGLDHLPHQREFDAGDGNVCHWVIEGKNVYELTICGIRFHASNDVEDEDNDEG